VASARDASADRTCDDLELVAAVSAVGGLSAFAASWMELAELSGQIGRIVSATAAQSTAYRLTIRSKRGLSVVVEMGDVEARSRLSSVRDVCEHEMHAPDALRDLRLSGVLQAMTTLCAEIVAALASFEQPTPKGEPFES
jgi:hypothetical protein